MSRMENQFNQIHELSGVIIIEPANVSGLIVQAVNISISFTFRRFAVLHTLKHGILWALPKFTGLDVGSFRGMVNPGFDSNITGIPNDLDLLIIDTNDGGSGAIHLINRMVEKYIVPMALEILTMAALPSLDIRRANLNLPYTCAWFNRNLCPVLTGKFISQL